MEPAEALDRFDTARGHKQERQNYLDSIRNKSWENGGDLCRPVTARQAGRDVLERP